MAALQRVTLLLVLWTVWTVTAGCAGGNAPDAGEGDQGEGEGEGDAGEGEGDAGEGEGEGEGEPPYVPTPDAPDNATRDSDCDGLSDAEEFGNVYPGGGHTDPADADSDNDSLSDGQELGRTHSVASACAARFIPDADPTAHTNPLAADSDGDARGDGVEDANRNGAFDRATETDPNNPDTDGDGLCDGDVDVAPRCTGGDPAPLGAATDDDGDGVPDAVDPDAAHVDADGDGLCDGPALPLAGCVFGEDLDGDGYVDDGESDPRAVDGDCDGVDDPVERTAGTDPADADSDGDGLIDGLELGAVGRLADARCAAFAGDADALQTDPLDADSDDDGVPDGAEDTNHSGGVDGRELDPHDPADGTDATVHAACAGENLVALAQPVVAEADIQFAVPAGTFAERATLQAPADQSPVGFAAFDAATRTGLIVVRATPAGSNAVADDEALHAALNTVATAVTSLRPQHFTTWDGYDALLSAYRQSDASGVKARLNAVVEALVPGHAAPLSTAVDPLAGEGFQIAAEVVRRSDRTSVLVVALGPVGFSEAGTLLVRDLADGSALAQAADSTGAHCERLASQDFAKLDILWAVDNSASMGRYQTAVASAGAAMQERLTNATVDVRTAALTSSFFSPAGVDLGCTNTVCADALTSQCRHFTNDLSELGGWMTSTDSRWLGAGGDCNQARESSARGAELMLTAPTANSASFLPAQAEPDDVHLRAGTNLLVIFLGDADDMYFADADAAVRPLGFTTQTADAGAVHYRDVLSGLVTGDVVRSVQLGGVVCTKEATTRLVEGKLRRQACGEDQRAPHVLQSLINSFGGVVGSIDELEGIPDVVTSILDDAITNASPYVLERVPITTSVKVAMAPGSTLGDCNTADVPRSRANGFDVDPNTRTLAFFGDCRPDPTRPGAAIAVSYQTWLDQSPLADPPPPPCDICGSCGGLEHCDADACACVCDAELTCAPGFTFDDDTCACVCDADTLACGVGYRADADLCACVCAPDCGDTCGPQELCNASLCSCTFVGG